MERPKSPYSIHSRPTKRRNRSIYYAQFRDETGACGAAVSTGCTAGTTLYTGAKLG
jgi:hypothetical protein